MYVLSPCKKVYRSQSQDKVDILVQTVYNNLRYVFVAVVYRMARKSRQNTPRNMYKGTAEILYFFAHHNVRFPLPDLAERPIPPVNHYLLGLGRHKMS